MKTLVCEQGKLLIELENDLKMQCNIKGQMTTDECMEFSVVLVNNPAHGYQLDKYSVKRQDVVDAIDEVGGYIQISMDELRSSDKTDDKESYNNIVPTFANFLLQVVVGISKICAERNNQNSSGDQLPPVLPLDLCSVLSRDFMSCLQQQQF